MKLAHTPLTRKWTVGLLTLATVVTSGWVGDGLKGDCLFAQWIGHCEPGTTHPYTTLLAGLVFGAALYLLYLTAKGLVPVRHLAQTPTVTPREVLIAALSPFDPLPKEDASKKLVVAEDKIGGKCVTITGNIDGDIEAFTKAEWRWAGQQYLRALRPHVQARTLKDLVLIGSSGRLESFSSIAMAEKLALLYEPSVRVHRHPDKVNFEDIECLQGVFDRWIEHFRDAATLEKQIIIDATGGQKTTSIAAALTTLRWTRVEFQYVQTEGKDGKAPQAIAFNVIVETAQKGLDL